MTGLSFESVSLYLELQGLLVQHSILSSEFWFGNYSYEVVLKSMTAPPPPQGLILVTSPHFVHLLFHFIFFPHLCFGLILIHCYCSDAKHRRNKGITGQSDISGTFRVSDRNQDHVKEGKPLSSGSRNTLEEQV